MRGFYNVTTAASESQAQLPAGALIAIAYAGAITLALSLYFLMKHAPGCCTRAARDKLDSLRQSLLQPQRRQTQATSFAASVAGTTGRPSLELRPRAKSASYGTFSPITQLINQIKAGMIKLFIANKTPLEKALIIRSADRGAVIHIDAEGNLQETDLDDDQQALVDQLPNFLREADGRPFTMTLLHPQQSF